MKMKYFGKSILGLCLFSTLALGGCGSNKATLVLSPSGPTVIKLGETLQFTVNRDVVTFSVEGGAENGSIDSSGLYSPPTTLPPGPPEVTVFAEDSDGETAEAFVSLRTADTLTVGSARPVNDSPIAADIIVAFAAGFNSKHLAVQDETATENLLFTQLNNMTANVFLSKSVDFGDFLPAINIHSQTTDQEFASSLEIDSAGNPHALFMEGDSTPDSRLMMVSSSDQGASYGAPVPIAPTLDAMDPQLMAYMGQDDNGRLHVVFFNPDDANVTHHLQYVNSSDGGATWTEPVQVFSSPAASAPIFPTLAVSPDGQNLYVTFFEGGEQKTYFSRSQDGGASFSTPIPLTELINNPFSDVALAPDGSVYVLTVDDPDGDTMFDVYVLRSTDGGASFAAPVLVNDVPLDTNDSLLSMSVDNLGRIDTVWTAGVNNLTLYHSRSDDQGASFGASQIVVDASGGITNGFIQPMGLVHDEAARLYIPYAVLDGDNLVFNVFVQVAQ